MRRESSTVVALVGEVDEALLAGLGRSANVSVARAPAPPAGQPGQQAPPEPAPVRPAWETGALALREAARRQSTYVIVPDDPLADVASQWRAMWEPGGSHGAAGFEGQAAEALAAWRGQQFELPDYYLVVVGAEAAGPDLYLGPLRAARPRRVAVAGMATGLSAQLSRLQDALGSLEYGPWWPPLDDLLDTARRFYAGALTESQPARA